MKFIYSKHNLAGRDKALQRFFEILPGMISWTTLVGMTGLAFVKPLIAAILIIAFNLYWFLRLIYMTIFLVLSYLRLKIEKKTNWMSRIAAIDKIFHFHNSSSANSEDIGKKPIFNSDYFFRKEIETLKKNHTPPPLSRDIYHLVIYPIIKESREIVEPSIRSLSEQQFPSNRIILVLALENRAPEIIKIEVKALADKYKNSFFDLLTITHPSDLPGEARVKGANVTFAAKAAAQYFKIKSIPSENIVVSCFDADTVVTPEYFACLTYNFMITPNRTRSSFQPIPVYHNNIWDVPGFARVMDSGSSFFQLIEATNPEKLVTFSSHSMSFQALAEIDYWPVDMISDDSAIFWKAYLHYDGEYQVIPIYVTLSMDIVAASNWWQTAKSIYKQKRRWAWGVENFPIVMRGFLKSQKISFYNKFRHGFKLLEGYVAWASWSFLSSIIGWLPIIFAGREFERSVVYYNAPRITATIFQLASLSLLISIILSLLLMPKAKIKYPWRIKVLHAFEWLLVPVIFILLSAIPALDAQTRLMFGRHMEFWVADKRRKDVKVKVA